MRHETKKICKIVDELTTLLLKDDTDEVDFKIKKDDKKTLIKIIDYNTRYSSDEVEYIRECLSVERQQEVEEYYWQLAGESDNDCELTLVGAMIDDVTITFEKGNLYIDIVRNK